MLLVATDNTKVRQLSRSTKEQGTASIGTIGQRPASLQPKIACRATNATMLWTAARRPPESRRLHHSVAQSSKTSSISSSLSLTVRDVISHACAESAKGMSGEGDMAAFLASHASIIFQTHVFSGFNSEHPGNQVSSTCLYHHFFNIFILPFTRW